MLKAVCVHEVDSAGRSVMYEGGWVHGTRHGWGRETVVDETGARIIRYEGEFSTGKRHGTGTVFTDAGVRQFMGDLVGGRAHGHGCAYHADGVTLAYVGEHHVGRRHGVGSSYHADGSKDYAGHWRDDFPHGVGVSWSRKASTFTGTFRQGERHGLFSEHAANGDRYEGEYANDVRHGGGKYWDASGRLMYEGDFVDNLPHGMGKEYVDGVLAYVGTMRADVRHGKGTVYLSDGVTVQYTGGMKDGRWHGWGTVYASDGDVLFEGVFVHGVADVAETGRKRKADSEAAEERERVVKMHREATHLTDVPQCAVCFDFLHHGDVAFAYVPCGHRALCAECADGMGATWRDACVLCKAPASLLMRVYG